MRHATAVVLCVSILVLSFPISTSADHDVDPSRELLITNLGVVEDYYGGRTYACGPWTFCGLMTALAGPNNPAAIARSFLWSWTQTQYVNGYSVPNAPRMQDVINYWPKKSNGEFDLMRAPFRLLAIVNRFDLADAAAGNAGEARFVFGLLDQYGNPRHFTMIFEYKMSTAVQPAWMWASEWHALSLQPVGSTMYNAQLQALTDKFSRTLVNGKIPLAQIRTNDGSVCLGNNCMWEWREFNQLSHGAVPSLTTLKQTPHDSFQNTATLSNWINNNEWSILNGTHTFTLPLKMGGNSRYWLGTKGPSFNNQEARFQFSMATCSGCHGGETRPPDSDYPGSLFQIKNRRSYEETVLHDFFRPIVLQDDSGILRVHDEMGRRRDYFSNYVHGGGGGSWQGWGVQSNSTSQGVSVWKSRVH